MELAQFVGVVLKFAVFAVGLVLVILMLPLAPLFRRWSRRGPPRYSRAEVAQVIENFCHGGGADYDWDDFISSTTRDAHLELVRQRCLEVADDYPPLDGKGWCSKEGIEVLLSYARELREHEV